MSAILELHDVKRSFGGVTAVAGLSFAVEEHEILGLIGPNGAGKTTIVNLISGFIKPSAGTVLLNGTNVTGLSAYRLARRGLVRTFQSTTVFSGRTVRENALRGAFLSSHPGWISEFLATPKARRQHEEAEAVVDELLHELELASVAEQVASGLPYGMQKALGIVIALAARPKIILLDEPVAGLSAEEASHVRDTLIKVRNRGVTVVVIDHNMRFISGLCDRVVVVNQGKELAQGKPDIVLADPAVIEAYLGASYHQARAS